MRLAPAGATDWHRARDFRRPYRGLRSCLQQTGGLRHRLISISPPGFRGSTVDDMDEVFFPRTSQPAKFRFDHFHPFVNSNLFRISRPSVIRSSGVSRFNGSTRLCPNGLRRGGRFNPSTLQRFNGSTLQPFNPSTRFCEVLQCSLNCDFLGITTSDRYIYAVFSSLSAARQESNLRVLQIFGGESVSEQDFFCQGYLVKLYSSLKLVAVGFISANPGLGFIGFRLQRCGIIS